VDERYAIESDKAFLDEGVLVAARFFDCVRLSAESAAADPHLRRAAKKTPCLLLVRPNGKVAKTLGGTLTPKRLYGAMNTALRLDYANSVSKTMKAQQKLLKERTKLLRERTRIARLEGASKSEAQASLEARRNDLDAREARLYALRPRP